MQGTLRDFIVTAERVWSVRCVAYALSEAKYALPEGAYTLPQFLDHLSQVASLTWTQRGDGLIALTRNDRRTRTQQTMPSRTKWTTRERLAVSAVHLIDSLSEEDRERLREGHRIGTWRLSPESLRWLSVLVATGNRAPYESPSPSVTQSLMARYAHTELEVRFRPEVLVYHRKQTDPVGPYDSLHLLVPLPRWAGAVQPRYQPAPEDLPSETAG